MSPVFSSLCDMADIQNMTNLSSLCGPSVSPLPHSFMFIIQIFYAIICLLGIGVQSPKFKYGVKSPKFIWAPCAQLYSLAETHTAPPFPLHLGLYTWALLVSQHRPHLFVTPLGFSFSICRVHYNKNCLCLWMQSACWLDVYNPEKKKKIA